MRPPEFGRKPPEPQGTLKVTLYPLDPREHELTEPSFTRYFPDMATYLRIREHFRWDYKAIEVWERQGQGQEWVPNAEQTLYTRSRTRRKITDPIPTPEEERTEPQSLAHQDAAARQRDLPLRYDL